MDPIKDLIFRINQLPKEDQLKVFQHFNGILNESSTGEHEIYKVRKEIHEGEPIYCPHCKSEHWILFGKIKGVQKYRCKECNRVFTPLTGTSVHWIHKKDKWNVYLDCMLQSMSLHKCAKEAGISYKTSFDWRHKILKSLKDIGCNKLTGVIEADETFFLSSRKGRKKIRDRKPRKRGGTSEYGTSKRLCVLTAIDRNQNLRLSITGIGNPSSEQIVKTMDPWVIKQNNKLKKSILCTDGSNSYHAFAKKKNLTHFRIPGYDVKWTKPKVYHLQHVNNTHRKLKEWIRIFHGVSDRYMINYLSYFRILELSSKYNDRNKSYREMSLTKNSVYIPIENIQQYHQKQFKSI